ncbi:MAG TPA: glutamate 5-kinase [Prevotellaceae bacterium]|nr:glutamate 5-kinase [Prevotellaceae bacterium]
MRYVIKVGSNVLTRPDGKLDITRMSALVDQVAWLRAQGHEVVLVSSGAVACGRGELRAARRLDSVEQRQLYSALGQAKLINLYFDLFREYGLHVGQVLTMKENFSSRQEYLNQRACMEVMLANGVIPIVNENDTVSVTELMFTDNDELSGLIASMLNAHCLIILSNIDGIYTGSPGDPASRLIAQVKPGDDLTPYIQTERSGFGRGGMLTKCNIARRVAEEGIRVIIANGRRDNILPDLLTRPQEVPHTDFLPASQPVSGIKKWLAHSQSFAKGELHINAQAARALHGNQAVSLLMVGVTQVCGDFEEGDIVSVMGPDGNRLGIGRSAYSATEARAAMGKHDVNSAIHYDYLCLDQ